jgi:hypothetical protein
VTGGGAPAGGEGTPGEPTGRAPKAFVAVDLAYPNQHDPIGRDHSHTEPDWRYYFVWVPRPRGSGWLPKLALHLVDCRGPDG